MIYFWGWLLLFALCKYYLCYEIGNLAVLELFLQSEKEQWGWVGSCTLHAAVGATGNLEVLACGLTDETQMCFPVQCLPRFALFPVYVQVHRIQRKPGYEPLVHHDFILHNNCSRKGNRVSEAWFDVLVLKITCVKLYLPYSCLKGPWTIACLEICDDIHSTLSSGSTNVFSCATFK